MLGGRPRADFRVENLVSIEPDRLFSPLRMLARSEFAADMSCTVARSIKAWGKIPHLPLEFVPDQHQYSSYGPTQRVSFRKRGWSGRVSSRRQLTVDVRDYLVLVELQPIALELIFVLGVELPPSYTPYLTCPSHFDFLGGRLVQSQYLHWH